MPPRAPRPPTRAPRPCRRRRARLFPVAADARSSSPVGAATLSTTTHRSSSPAFSVAFDIAPLDKGSSKLR
ncbi:unnamed protein product [Urochloa humidicola]